MKKWWTDAHAMRATTTANRRLSGVDKRSVIRRRRPVGLSLAAAQTRCVNDGRLFGRSLFDL